MSEMAILVEKTSDYTRAQGHITNITLITLITGLAEGQAQERLISY